MSKKPLLLALFLILSTTFLFSSPIGAEQNLLSLLFGAFIAGLFLTFTPCVLPMIPILSSIIAGQGSDISTKKAVFLSLSYVMGTAVTYAVMGALAGATGEQLQSYFQNIWVIGIMSMVFVLMSLSMFGFYNIQMPSFIQSKLDKSSHGIKGGSVPMVFLLGMVSALILGACVSPVLISFLGVAISTGDATLGALTMFFMALGMGVPLILVGFGAGHLLPKVGGWMENIKYLFGVMLIAVAIQIFNQLNLFSPLLLWGMFLIVISVYLTTINRVENEFNGLQKFIKGVGLVLLIWGAILLVGAAYGESNFLKPLPKTSIKYVENQGTKTQQAITSNSTPFSLIGSLGELEAKQKEAKEAHKLLIIYFYTDWCPVCKHLNETTMQDPTVQKELATNFIALKVNMTNKEDSKSQALKKKFNIFGPPAFVIFERDGEYLEDDSFYGYQEPEEFFDTLDLFSDE